MTPERHKQILGMSTAERFKEMLLLKMARDEVIQQFLRSEPVREIETEIEYLQALFGFGMPGEPLDADGKSLHAPSQPK